MSAGGDEHVDATGYLVLQASRSQFASPGASGLRPVNHAKIAAFRANRPARLELDQIAIRVTVRVPSSTFDPISPEALIVVPEGLILRGPTQVDAVDANEVEQ